MSDGGEIRGPVLVPPGAGAAAPARPGGPTGPATEAGPGVHTLTEPDKLVRITAMVRELLEETRQAPPDERGRARLREIYERSLQELEESLPAELSEELRALAPPIEGVPTESEIRVAQAQLVGWLEGLFHGIQAAVWAQQMAARAQLEEVRRRGLPPGMGPPDQQQQQTPGQYL